MTFSELPSFSTDYRFLGLDSSAGTVEALILAFDFPLSDDQVKLMENFGKLSGSIVLIFPVKPVHEIPGALIDHISSLISRWKKSIIVVSGKFAPFLVSDYAKFSGMDKAVFIDPEFRPEDAPRMSSFETPCLVVTGTSGNLDHDPSAVKYHDLISGSRIQYVRGITGNPLLARFTQSFNSIQRFLSDE